MSESVFSMISATASCGDPSCASGLPTPQCKQSTASHRQNDQEIFFVFRFDWAMNKPDEGETGLAIRMPTNLMGIDVGFSTSRPTTGIAFLNRDQLHLVRARTEWKSREATIPKGFQPSVIAIDGPLLPLGADRHIRRHVESVFIRAPFHNRCKPGLSHHGVGLELRRASSEACAQFGALLASSVL